MKTSFLDRLENWGLLAVALLIIMAALALAGCKAERETPTPAPPPPQGISSLWGLLDEPATPIHLQEAQANAYQLEQWISAIAIFLGAVALASGKFPNWIGFGAVGGGVGLMYLSNIIHLYGWFLAKYVILAVLAAVTVATVVFLFKSRGKIFSSIRELWDGRNTPTTPTNETTTQDHLPQT